MSPHVVESITTDNLNGSEAPKTVALHRDMNHVFPRIVRGEGSYLVKEDGQRILDASGGAAVISIGHGDKRVVDACAKQMSQVAYCATVFFTNDPYERLSRILVDSTSGRMARAYIVNSGSEAMESAIKMARQYFLEKADPEPQRTRFIARRQSYHGITLGALSVGGHVYRREKFKPLMSQNTSHVSPCYPYRDKKDNVNETDEAYVSRLAAELNAEFERVGADTVCAFVAEPVVGAALGCVTAVPGYFQAVEAVCRKHGALLILDEVMCGMGRTGTLHAWEQEGVVPDIQTMGKALSGGYQPAAAVLIGHRVNDALERGTGVFVHGHTYQGHAVVCAAAIEVQRIVREENLLANVRSMGKLLSKGLQESIGGHPNIGNIRGRGLFWGIEFVKEGKLPFPAKDHVAIEIAAMGIQEPYNVSIYPGSGTVDGVQGDHVIVSPPYNVTEDEVALIVDAISRLVTDFFAKKSSA